MRWLLLLSLLVASPAAAQVFNPAADYITAGQDEPGYRAWMARASWRPVYVRAFNDYLVTNGVGGVAPTWQLLRTATDWQRCGAEPFEVPPCYAWPNIVAALRYVGAYVEPVIGPVEIVSVYRNPRLNACAGGAPESTHRTMGAVDMVPLRPITREALMTQPVPDPRRQRADRTASASASTRAFASTSTPRKFREWGTAGAAAAGDARRCWPKARRPMARPPVRSRRPGRPALCRQDRLSAAVRPAVAATLTGLLVVALTLWR